MTICCLSIHRLVYSTYLFSLMRRDECIISTTHGATKPGKERQAHFAIFPPYQYLLEDHPPIVTAQLVGGMVRYRGGCRPCPDSPSSDCYCSSFLHHVLYKGFHGTATRTTTTTVPGTRFILLVACCPYRTNPTNTYSLSIQQQYLNHRSVVAECAAGDDCAREDILGERVPTQFCMKYWCPSDGYIQRG